MQENNSVNNLTIEQQKNITVTGVSAVNAFSETQIILTLQSIKLQINGTSLKIADFSKESGHFFATGEISAVKYLSSSAKFKIFK